MTDGAAIGKDRTGSGEIELQDLGASDFEDTNKTVNLAADSTTASESGAMPEPTSAGNATAQAAVIGAQIQSAFMAFKSKYVDGSGADGLEIESIAGSAQSTLSSMGNMKVVMRPWLGEFVVVQKPTGFVPSVVLKNVNYFKWNYAVCIFILLVMGLLTSPAWLMSLGLTGMLWAWFAQKNNNPEWQPKLLGRDITPQIRMGGMVAFTSLFLLWAIGSLIFGLIGFGAVLTVGHAVCHQPVKDYSQVLEDEGTEKVAMTGDVV